MRWRILRWKVTEKLIEVFGCVADWCREPYDTRCGSLGCEDGQSVRAVE